MLQIHLRFCQSRAIRFLTCLDKCVIFLQPIILIYELLKEVMDSCNLLSFNASWVKFNIVALGKESLSGETQEQNAHEEPIPATPSSLSCEPGFVLHASGPLAGSPGFWKSSWDLKGGREIDKFISLKVLLNRVPYFYMALGQIHVSFNPNCSFLSLCLVFYFGFCYVCALYKQKINNFVEESRVIKRQTSYNKYLWNEQDLYWFITQMCLTTRGKWWVPHATWLTFDSEDLFVSV